MCTMAADHVRESEVPHELANQREGYPGLGTAVACPNYSAESLSGRAVLSTACERVRFPSVEIHNGSQSGIKPASKAR